MPDEPDTPKARDDQPASAPSAVDRLIHGAGAAAGPIVGGMNAALDVAASTINEMPGMRVRRVRRLGRQPLPSLHALFPDVDRARPILIGLRSIPVDRIRGTAVAGGDQRGGDFLPLKPFRGKNWQARWQRLRRAHDALEILPAIDVEKYDDAYWVVDGHNRVAVAKYANQPEIDASVVELVAPGGKRTESIGTLEAELDASRPVRGLTLRPATDVRDKTT